jgi:hypothetical protein
MKKRQKLSQRITAFTLGLLALLAITSRSTPGQSQTTTTTKPEVDQLKERLLLLEQTVRDLKGQINAMEESQKKPLPPAAVEVVNGTAEGVPIAAPATPAKPQDGKGESTFTIYGFAMLDAGYQFKQNDLIGST